MKTTIKLFSLLLMLFIVTAGNAFTRNQQKSKFFQLYAVWGIYPYHIWNPYFDPPTVLDLECSVAEILYSNISPLSYVGYSNLQEFRDEYQDGYLICSANNEYICIAYVTYPIGSLGDGVVIDLVEGDYYHEYD